jgi:hypothetical protein
VDVTRPLTASLGELAGPRLERIEMHPTTGQPLVLRRRVVRGPAFLRDGKPLDLVWAKAQAFKLADKGRDAEHIAKVFRVNGKVTRGDGTELTAGDVEGWLE